MSEIKNFWPDNLLQGNYMVLPVTILQQQAKYLNDITKNILVARVDAHPLPVLVNSDIEETKQGIMYVLKIMAPLLGNYDFDLIKVIQEELLPYPLKVLVPLTEKTYDITAPEQLESVLVAIFKNIKVVTVIQSLIAQSKSKSESEDYLPY